MTVPETRCPMWRQDVLYKDYTSNPTPSLHPFLILDIIICGLCYEITGKGILKQKQNINIAT